MNILEDDYIVFVYFDHCMPGRSIYPAYPPNRMIETYRKGSIESSQISWSIGLLDVARVSKGYHIDFTDQTPYGVFDEEWLCNNKRKPEEKIYTQFIRTQFELTDEYCYYWNKDNNFSLGRELFHENNSELVEVVTALRGSLNSRGDAFEISRNAFNSLNQLLAKF